MNTITTIPIQNKYYPNNFITKIRSSVQYKTTPMTSQPYMKLLSVKKSTRE